MSDSPLKVLLQLPMSSLTGYGRDGIALTQALMKAGADVYLKPAHVDPPLPAEVAMLLTKQLRAPFDLLIDHQDPMALQLSPEARRASTFTVGWTMWEYSSFDNMEGKYKKTIRKRIKDYDLLLGYDHVSTRCFDPYLPKKGAPELATIQGGYDPSLSPPVERDWFTPGLNFCMVGMLNDRKDPFVAIQAFMELWNENEDFRSCRLSLKTSIPGLHSKLSEICPGITVYYETWSTEKLISFYNQHHVLLAPSRGEGKNLPALEFQTTGGVVIATNWGGHQMWINSEYAFPINYTLKPVEASKPNCLNARADKDHLKQLMLEAFNNRGELKRMGELASNVIPEMCNWNKVVERLMNRISECGPKGMSIYNKYLALEGEKRDRRE